MNPIISPRYVTNNKRLQCNSETWARIRHLTLFGDPHHLQWLVVVSVILNYPDDGCKD